MNTDSSTMTHALTDHEIQERISHLESKRTLLGDRASDAQDQLDALEYGPRRAESAPTQIGALPTQTKKPSLLARIIDAIRNLFSNPAEQQIAPQAQTASEEVKVERDEELASQIEELRQEIEEIRAELERIDAELNELRRELTIRREEQSVTAQQQQNTAGKGFERAADTAQNKAIVSCLVKLAGKDDGAATQDGLGFSKDHSEIGRTLAQKGDGMTNAEMNVGRDLVRLYRRQLDPELVDQALKGSPKKVVDLSPEAIEQRLKNGELEGKPTRSRKP